MVSREKSQSHACVFFLSSHVGLWKCRILIFASYIICRLLYSRQKAVLIIEAPSSVVNKRTGYIMLTLKGTMNCLILEYKWLPFPASSQRKQLNLSFLKFECDYYIYRSMFISVYIRQPVPFFSRSPSRSGILWKEVRVFPCSWQSSIRIPIFNKPGESCTFVTKINTSPTQGCLCLSSLFLMWNELLSAIILIMFLASPFPREEFPACSQTQTLGMYCGISHANRNCSGTGWINSTLPCFSACVTTTSPVAKPVALKLSESGRYYFELALDIMVSH